MKEFLIFLLIALFNPIINAEYEYDLIINKESIITSLTERNYYYFYFPSNIYKEFNINIILNYNSSQPFSSITVLEYYNKTKYRDSFLQQVTISKENDEYITSFSFSTKYIINYIGLQIIPESKIDYLKIKVTIPYTYELVNGVAEKIMNLKYQNYLYFFTSANFFQSISINITLDKNYTRPIFEINIYEMEERYSPNYINYIKYSYLNISSYTDYDSIQLSKYLVRGDNTNEIVLEIQISSGASISYTLVKMDVEDSAFELSNGVTKNLTNLKSGNPYYFFIPSNYLQNATLYMNYSSTKLIDCLYIYEYENRNATDYLEKIYQNVSTTTTTNELSLTSVYLVKNNHTKYIAFNIIPNENIDFINVKINVYNNIFYLSDSVAQKIINLEAGYAYYFIIPSAKFQVDSINLTMNYMIPKPFNHVYIYEYKCSDSDYRNALLSRNYLKFTNQLITSSKIGNTLEFSIIYKVDELDTNYVFLEITPSYNINYLIINNTVEGGAYYIKKSTDINIDSLKIYNSYYFIIESSLFNYILINLTMNYNYDDKPFDDFYIYKYEDINNVSLYLNKTSHSFKTSINKNKLICWYNFTVYDNYTKYIIVKIKPKYNLQNLITKIIVKGGAFYLKEGRNIRISNLKSGNTYLFLLNSSLLQKVNYNANCFTTYLPNYLYIDEYKTITDISTYLKTSYQKVSRAQYTSIDFTYFVTNKDTKYIGLKITPRADLSYIYINASTENHLFELSTGEKKNFYGFSIGSKYYIFLANKNEQEIKVTMNLYGYIEEPFSYLYAYELYNDYQINNYYRKKIIYVEKDSTDKNKRTISYSPYYSRTQIALEITPNSSLISMTCELEYLDGNNFSVGIIILIIFISLFFLITIICIIRKCKQRREANLMADPMIQSLQPINEHPQEENIYNPNQACPKEISNDDPYKNQQQQQYD